MYTTTILYHRDRSGTSTVLGTLIFVGILFTAFIPMLLVMKQVDTLHEMRKIELARLDEERDVENLYVYAHGTESGSSYLTVEVKNKGYLSAKVVSLWINDEFFELNKLIPPMSEIEDLGSFDVPRLLDFDYIIMVATDRGKIFVFNIPLTWTINGWKSTIISIEVIIENLNPPHGEFKILITAPNPEDNREAMAQKNELTCFTFTKEGTYIVEIFRGGQCLYGEDLELDFENNPLGQVFA